MNGGNGSSDCATRRENYRLALNGILTGKSLDEFWLHSQAVQAFNQHAQGCRACRGIKEEIAEALQARLRKKG